MKVNVEVKKGSALEAAFMFFVTLACVKYLDVSAWWLVGFMVAWGVLDLVIDVLESMVKKGK